jgi:hypothetical protein
MNVQLISDLVAKQSQLRRELECTTTQLHDQVNIPAMQETQLLASEYDKIISQFPDARYDPWRPYHYFDAIRNITVESDHFVVELERFTESYESELFWDVYLAFNAEQQTALRDKKIDRFREKWSDIAKHNRENRRQMYENLKKEFGGTSVESVSSPTTQM